MLPTGITGPSDPVEACRPKRTRRQGEETPLGPSSGEETPISQDGMSYRVRRFHPSNRAAQHCVARVEKLTHSWSRQSSGIIRKTWKVYCCQWANLPRSWTMLDFLLASRALPLTSLGCSIQASCRSTNPAPSRSFPDDHSPATGFCPGLSTNSC